MKDKQRELKEVDLVSDVLTSLFAYLLSFSRSCLGKKGCSDALARFPSAPELNVSLA